MKSNVNKNILGRATWRWFFFFKLWLWRILLHEALFFIRLEDCLYNLFLRLLIRNVERRNDLRNFIFISYELFKLLLVWENCFIF